MALAAERNAQKKNNVVDPKVIIFVPESSHPAPAAASDPTAKKVSRLKHFFSPIRKKAVKAPPIPPPINSHPDVFIGNMLPNNLYINPSMLPSNGVNQSQVKPGNITEVTSPTSSFQVRIVKLLIANHFDRSTLFFSLSDRRKPRRTSLRHRSFIERYYGASNAMH